MYLYHIQIMTTHLRLLSNNYTNKSCSIKQLKEAEAYHSCQFAMTSKHTAWFTDCDTVISVLIRSIHDNRPFSRNNFTTMESGDNQHKKCIRKYRYTVTWQTGTNIEEYLQLPPALESRAVVVSDSVCSVNSWHSETVVVPWPLVASGWTYQ